MSAPGGPTAADVRYRRVLAVLLSAAMALAALRSLPDAPKDAPVTQRIQPGDEFTLAPGGAARLPDGPTVVFVGVVEDERCPQGWNCDWPGDADVAIAFIRDRSEPVVRVLHTYHRHTTKTTSGGGLTIHLVELFPEARQDGVPIEEYRARLKVS